MITTYAGHGIQNGLPTSVLAHESFYLSLIINLKQLSNLLFLIFVFIFPKMYRTLLAALI